MENEAKKKSKAPKVILIIVLVLVLLAAAAGGSFVMFGGSMGKNLSQEVTIEIPDGATANQIEQILSDNGLVFNAISFKIYLKTQSAESLLKKGTYTFGPGKVTYEELMETLKKGNIAENTVDVTIPEGYTVDQIAQVLEQSGVCTAQEFLDYLSAAPVPYDYIPEGDSYVKFEGFLFPNTYNMSTDWTPAQVLDLLTSSFNEIWTEDRINRAGELGMSALDIITIASMVEREALLDRERPTVASVIYNRINKGMLLQIDATVQYALGEQKERLLYSDLEIDSPYNTYLYEGMPPGPIANPGLASIDAALYPADTPYYYYQTTVENDGSHYFCETYEEHTAYTAQKKQQQ